jgi:alpha-D-ribose 1-methylphosphonate 5-triphosphate synthase subunit PhnH
MPNTSALYQSMPGFDRPVFDAQETFRALLKTMACPGTIMTTPLAMQVPERFNLATAAIALTLFDLDTPVWADFPYDAAALEWLRFHCGNPVVQDPDQAVFALVSDLETMLPLKHFGAGLDAHPETSSTLIIQIEKLDNSSGFDLEGPGIKSRQARLFLKGLPAEFWMQREELMNCFPRGIDMIFTQGSRIAALPRTTHVKV